MPRAVLAWVAVLCGIVAAGAVLIGRHYAARDVTQMITRVADHHVARHGGAPTDCQGWPAGAGGAIRVRCAGTLYEIGAFGRITQLREGGT